MSPPNDLRRSTPPFRAEHVGSLLRAPEVVQARGALKRGEITATQLRAVEDAAVRNLVKLQEDLGLKGVTDGEIRRNTWHMDFIEQIGGLSHVQSDPNMKVTFHSGQGDISFTPSGLRADQPLSLEKTIFGDDFAFLKSVTRQTPKLTIPSPSMVHYRGVKLAPDVYPGMEPFWADLKRVYAAADCRPRQAGVHLPAARRHEPRVSQRPLRSASTSPSSAATRRTSTASTSI